MLNHTLIYAAMKDHRKKKIKKIKKASELISLNMKEKETVRGRGGVRGRETGRHLLTSVGGIKGSEPVICLSLCVDMEAPNRQPV